VCVCVCVLPAVVLMLETVRMEDSELVKLCSHRITAVSPCRMVMLSVDLWLSTLVTGNPVGIKHSSRNTHACRCRSDVGLHTNISTENNPQRNTEKHRRRDEERERSAE